MTTDNTASMSQVPPFLAGAKLELLGFNEETQQDLTEWVTEAGGEIVYMDFKGTLDYLVVPVEGGESRHKARKVVTRLWLEDCLDEGKLLPPAYYHEPLDKVDRAD